MSTILYRVAAVLFVLFAAGHTFGFLKFKPTTPDGIAVRDSMKSVHFRVESGDYSYGGFYDGFGWYISAYMLFSAFLAWQLGNLAASSPHVIGALAAGVAVMIQTAGVGRSNEEPVTKWLDEIIQADQFLAAGNITEAIGSQAPVDPQVMRELRTVEGVGSVAGAVVFAARARRSASD